MLLLATPTTNLTTRLGATDGEHSPLPPNRFVAPRAVVGAIGLALTFLDLASSTRSLTVTGSRPTPMRSPIVTESRPTLTISTSTAAESDHNRPPRLAYPPCGRSLLLV
uniref:Uncharacterized protein n=1 Tax=Arundo donax TaxID=35708 RepID=A0A0A9FQK6_ARUDO